MDVVVFAYAVFENAANLIKIQTKGVDLHWIKDRSNYHTDTYTSQNIKHG